MATVEPYRQLWTSVSQFYELYNTWMNGPFARLSPGDVTAQVERTSSTLEQLAAEFAQGGSNGGPWEVPAGVVREAQGKVARFSTYLPLVAAVCNPGLQERHLAAMSEVAGLDIKRDEVGEGGTCDSLPWCRSARTCIARRLHAAPCVPAHTCRSFCQHCSSMR